MSKWVCAWGVPSSFLDDDLRNVVEDTTLRHVFYCPINGAKIRLRFSNIYGKENAEITEAAICEWSGKGTRVIPETFCKVTFKDNGNSIKAGEELFSDVIEYSLEAGKYYSLNFYFKGLTRVMTGYSKFIEDKLSPNWYIRGNHIYEEEFPINCRRETRNYMFFCGIDTWSDDNTHAVMAFGDSITARPWPDLLARRINENGITNRSVVRKAIGGNRVLRDYRNCIVKRHMGIAAIDRFEISLNQIPGVDKVIMLEGINDICHPDKNNIFCGEENLPTASELIEGYKYCCNIAHKYGLKYYLATILPSTHTEMHGQGREEIRLEVNKWIRENDIIDGFIDFDKALKNPDNPHVLTKDFDCGDGLHPSMEGSMKLCATIPEHIFK